MIESLYVSNYVLIDKLDLEFSSGLNAITGETGSGKSIIMGAISLLLGAKADKEDVRKGEDKAEISGVFYTHSPLVASFLSSRDIDLEDNRLVIRRVIRKEGRTSYSVNGVPLSLKEAEELGELLVDFSSQHAHHSLMKKDVMREILDEFSLSLPALSDYQTAYKLYIATEKELDDTKREIEKSREEKDYMSYCLDEIEKADIKIGEEETLKDNLKKLSNSESLIESSELSSQSLREAKGVLSSALESMRKALGVDSSLSGYVDRLESASIEVDDIYESMRDYLSSLSFSEGEMEEMNTRLSIIQRIKRRYGGSVESVLKTKEEYREKLALINDSSERISELEKNKEKYRKEATVLAEKLSALRHKGAGDFSKKIENTLHQLGMENALFNISVTDDEMGLYGKDRIEFLITPNKGEKTSRIEESASGGELSRIMLSIKASSNQSGGVETLLFDEIDAGLGGTVASSVAEELLELSKKSQVITITHLAQIASRADGHYVVSKETVGDRTHSSIRAIEGEEREKEIARLLSGNITDISLSHAREMLSHK